jgi:predicted acyl esterase
MTYHGGILCTFFGNWFKKQVMTVQHGLGGRGSVNPNTGEFVTGLETLSDEELVRNRTDLGAAIRDHPLDDQYHRERSPDWSKVTVPMLSSANWGGQGLHPRGNFEGFVHAASKQKWLEVHGLEHWTEFYTRYGVTLQKRFFDHFLKGIDNEWKDKPPVQLQVRRVNGFVERPENEWPLARTQWTRLYLDPADCSLSGEPVDGEDRIEYEALGDGITFISPPLGEETEITGPVAAKLFVSSSTTDADLFVVLRVFAPDGSEVVFQGALDPHTPIGQGWLRASHRKLDPGLSTEYRPYHTHDVVEPLTPGEVYELDVEIWPTCIVVPAGYRIALTVRGKDYEYPGKGVRLATFVNELKGCGPFLHDDPGNRPPALFGGKNTLYAGGDRTAYVLLPIIPREDSSASKD